MVLGISLALGVIGVVSAFGLFYLGERVFHLDRAHIQTLMYLKLSVAGHLTVFLTRTRGPFWSIRPAGILWVAVVGTQIVATLIAVYGVFMMPLGWGWALFVWGYALIWFFLNDRVKLLAYRIFDPIKAKAASDLTPQITVGFINWPTILLLLGFFVLSAQLRLAGFLDKVAAGISARLGHPALFLLVPMLLTAGLSAFLNHDIVCFVFAPVVATALIRRQLNPVPFLIALAIASNIGAAATPVGKPMPKVA